MRTELHYTAGIGSLMVINLLYTTLTDKHSRVALVPCKKIGTSVRYYTVAYTRQGTYYKVPEPHGHV